MKGYIITTSFANNYGALLQNYALRKYIEKNFHMEIQTIDYWPENSENVWKVYYQGKSFRTIVRNVLVFFDVTYRHKMNRRKKMMLDFRDKYLNLTSRRYESEADIVKDKDKFHNSIFFCGSDQIWNTTSYWKDPVYFLHFVVSLNNSKAIAYAPSITDAWLPEHYEEIKGYLQGINSISVRENADVEQVRKLVPNRNVIQVIDPVFLQTKEFWDAFSKDGIKVEGKYILCYFLGTNASTIRLVKKVKEQTGYKVVYLNINYSNPINADIVLKEASPIDFVSLIKNAEIVINNSFHCSAFSVIFKKNYMVVPKNHANSRMQSLQDMAGIEDRLMFDNRIENLQPSDYVINYSKSDANLESILSLSKEYLKKAING